MWFYEKILLASLQFTVYTQEKKTRKNTNFKLKVLLKDCTVAIFDACVVITAVRQSCMMNWIISVPFWNSIIRLKRESE